MSFILFKNGNSILEFTDKTKLQQYVQKERIGDRYVKFHAMENGRLSHWYRTQQEIEEMHELTRRIVELEERILELTEG